MRTSLVTLLAVLAVAAAVIVRRPREARQRLVARMPAADQPATQPWSTLNVALGVAIASALVLLQVAVPVAAISGLVPAGVHWVRSRREVGALRSAREAACVEVTFALAGELRAGRTAREALEAAGATVTRMTAVQLHVDLPASARNRIVFECAREVGVQVRALEVRRESLEAAFLRVIGEPEPVPTGPAYREVPS